MQFFEDRVGSGDPFEPLAVSRSGSAAVLSGIVHPEVMALGVGVGSVGLADPFHPIEQGAVSQYCSPQISPVLPPTA